MRLNSEFTMVQACIDCEHCDPRPPHDPTCSVNKYQCPVFGRIYQMRCAEIRKPGVECGKFVPHKTEM